MNRHVYFNIREIRQEPASPRQKKREERRKTAPGRIPQKWAAFLGASQRHWAEGRRAESRGAGGRRTEKRPAGERAAGKRAPKFRLPRFALSGFRKALPFAASFFGVAMIALCSYFVLHGDRYSGISVIPPDDGVYGAALASYAGLGRSGLLPAGLEPEPAAGDKDIPLEVMETFAWESYTVKKGDTILHIAKDHSLSMDAVIASNGISNARRLREGQVLRLPNMDGIPYTVKNGDSLAKISAAQGVPLKAILDANDLESEVINAGTSLFIPGARMRGEELKLALGELFIYPVRGRLSSYFGWRQDPFNGYRRFHSAIDIPAPTGTPIKAAMDGKVSVVATDRSLGKYVILEHPGGYQTLYAHMSKTSVTAGSSVIQGVKIGEVGNTGRSTGAHIHFGVSRKGRWLNPLDFLN